MLNGDGRCHRPKEIKKVMLNKAMAARMPIWMPLSEPVLQMELQLHTNYHQHAINAVTRRSRPSLCSCLLEIFHFTLVHRNMCHSTLATIFNVEKFCDNLLKIGGYFLIPYDGDFFGRPAVTQLNA